VAVVPACLEVVVMPPDEEQRRFVSNAELQLELRAMSDRFERRIGDVKLWILGAVALNQFLAAVDLPSEVTAAAFLGVLAKGVVGVFFR
jgi:hypothetical protein